MRLQVTGPISFSEIIVEFPDVAPNSISEFYSANEYLPVSGIFFMSDFYGQANVVTDDILVETSFDLLYNDGWTI